MKDFSQRIAALSPAQRELLERRLKEKGSKNLKLELVSNSQPNPDKGVVSSAQERLWLLHQLQPELPLYNEINLVKLTGSLDISLLEQSFNRVVERHQVLRSKFVAQNGKPVAQIVPSFWITLPVIEIERRSNSEARAIALATQEARKPFNLSEFPLFRLKLYRLSEQEYLWLMVVHHIICDGWSMGIFVREIATLYADLKTGKLPSLPELPIQYADFARWEKQLPDNIFATQLNYWEKQLSGNLPKLEIPSINRQTKANNPTSCRGARESILLSPQLSQSIKNLSRKQNVTLFMLLLAAFKVLLYRYTDLADILVGSPIANRSRPELELAIGIFLNTLVLRSDLSGNPTFTELLQRIKKVALEAYAHQDLPFEKLVAKLHPERNISQSPLFQVMFILYNLPNSDWELPGLKVEEVAIDNGMALFDLTLEIRDSDRGLDVCCEYNCDRFSSEEIKRLLIHYQVILENVAIDPDLHLSQIKMLTQAEKQELLIEFNNNSRDYPVTQTIDRLFEIQAVKTPLKIAVIDRDTQLTYQELNAKANQIGRLLQSLGIQKGEFVSIWQERGVNFAVAILAVLKAGGVYVPIDSSYPSERIAYILANSESKILLCDRLCLKNSANILENCPHLKCIVGLDNWDIGSQVTIPQISKIYTPQDFQNLATENVEHTLTGIEPAYTIYTSGSTGVPKGTIIRHGGAINHIYAQYDALNLSADLTFLQSAPASSDISVWQFLAPVLVGGKTVIIDKETVCNPPQLFQLIQQNQITLAELVPVVLKSLINYISDLSPHKRELPSLQWMMVTGESVAVDLVNNWLKLYPTIPVVNAYGPSEASDDITQAIIDKLLPEEQTTVSMGKPLANLNLYILDSNLQLVPIGVPGEICVSGYGVGIGYWRNEEKTQASFIPNPFSETAKPLPGVETDLLYRTGDLGRWLPDGTIEYLGRIDNQVKIRGFRLELGEIETVVARHRDVSDCVVIPREDSLGEKRLVAYYIARQSLDKKQLREYLQPKLPEYMIPSAWVELESFPLTPNGKIERNSLPIPDFKFTNNKYIAPRNSTEEQIATIWKKVLNLKQVGIEDNFFELGGHSLLATQVVSQIRQSLSVELPLRCLFESPTVAELAKQIDNSILTAIPSIKPVKREGDLPLSFAQQRLWFLSQLEPDSPAYNIPEALRLQGKLDIEVLTQTIKAIIGRHETLRTNFKLVANEPVQVIHSEINFQLPIIDLSNLPQTERELEVTKLTEQEALQPFNLEQDSLLRVSLIRLDDLEHIILFTMHHIISDGWSIGILVGEVATFYQAFLAGKPSPLPELPIQYADYAVWQRNYLQGEVLDKQLSYWKQKLGGKLPVLKLPYRQQQPVVKTNRSLSHSFEISQDLTLALQQLSRQTDTTLFMVILGTLKTLLYRYTQQNDIVVGTDIANRNQGETEGLIGFFVNILVLRTDLSDYPSFKELLARIKDVTLSAYAHQDLPFDRLVQELQPSRQLNQTTLFQVLLVMDNVPTPELELPHLTISSIPEVDSYAKFDLVLFISETKEGIVGNWQYNSDLFDANTIAKLADSYVSLLQNIVFQADARIERLEIITQAAKEVQTMAEVTQEKNKFNRFLKVKPKAVSLHSSEELIKTSFLQPEQTLPLVITPAVKDLDIFDWVKNERQFLENKLLKHGAILFRDCQLNYIHDFEKLAHSICPNLFGNYGDLPRTGVSNKVYGSTPYPADKTILFHNESSHLHCYPQKIWFFCVQPAQEGGETPIVDCRQVYQLLAPQVREKLEEKQLMYVRNYIEGLDVSWQNFFHTEDKKVVEEHCHKSQMEFEWLPNNGLRTRKKRSAISCHPITQEKTFFNQIQLHHISYLDIQVRESLLSVFSEKDLPRNVYYGDGSPLEAEDIEAINRAYQEATISFPWQKGDVLMLDNLLTAHSRNPYKGERKIVVAMGAMLDSTNN